MVSAAQSTSPTKNLHPACAVAFQHRHTSVAGRARGEHIINQDEAEPLYPALPFRVHGKGAAHRFFAAPDIKAAHSWRTFMPDQYVGNKGDAA